MKKTIDLREYRDIDLRSELQSLLRAQLGARVRLINQTLTNLASIKQLRREISRVRTLLRERELGLKRGKEPMK